MCVFLFVENLHGRVFSTFLFAMNRPKSNAVVVWEMGYVVASIAIAIAIAIAEERYRNALIQTVSKLISGSVWCATAANKI